MAIDCDDIIGISTETIDTYEEEEIHDFNFDNPKSGFDVGGAVVGTLIAGTPGTIIGGMHNMGKDNSDKKPKTRMVKDYDIAPYFNYYDCVGMKESIYIGEQRNIWQDLLYDIYRINGKRPHVKSHKNAEDENKRG